jgi:uncharacterized protein YjbI with pentapeptide repeats
MTRLEDRLARLEQRTEEIHRMLMHLIELQNQSAAQLSETEPTAPSEQPASVPETSSTSDAPLEPIWVEPDPLEIQYQLVVNWAAAGRTEDLSDFDLSGRNLRNLDLKDAKLFRSNLSRGDLTASRLVRTEMAEADLSRAQMARVDLTRANLVQADLTFANLSYAKLEGAKLRYALLTRANLAGANLSGADLGGAQLNKADMTRVNLKDAAVNHRQLASVSALDGATMPDGRLYDGDPEPYKT